MTFRVTASGYAPLRHQWRKNGFEIAGANTSSYSIATAAEVDAGRYDVVISNIGGTATSAAAVLAVNALSQFAQTFPTAPPAAQGFVLVNLGPAELLTAPGITPAWRFAGEKEWRVPGLPVGGLTTGDRQIEFRPVPGYLQPLSEPVTITSGTPATVVEKEYFEAAGGGVTGSITVTLKPDDLAGASVPQPQRAQWRLLGEGDPGAPGDEASPTCAIAERR